LRRWLTLFAVLALAAWALADLAALGPYYFAILRSSRHFAPDRLLKPQDQADCLAKFKANAWIGLLLTAAVIAGHLA
jgi:4-hydroxybenzoate polyprenyltransferase